MNQASDMLLIQGLAFLEKKVTIYRNKLKNCHLFVKTEQDKIKSSNIVEKI